jgi:hypothetical protein
MTQHGGFSLLGQNKVLLGRYDERLIIVDASKLSEPAEKSTLPDVDGDKRCKTDFAVFVSPDSGVVAIWVNSQITHASSTVQFGYKHRQNRQRAITTAT